MDFNEVMRMVNQLREQLSSAENTASALRVRGESGAGLVEVVMNGAYEVLEVHIDPRTLVPSEVTLLEDLLRAAINQASIKVGDSLRSRVGDLGKRLGIDPSILGGGLGGAGAGSAGSTGSTGSSGGGKPGGG